MTVEDLFKYIDGFAPFSSAAEWDNSGLQVGDFAQRADKVLLSLDVTDEEIAFARQNGVSLIVSHHPLLFRGVKRIPFASMPAALIRGGISVISAHTNLDKATGGVNDALCGALSFPYEKCGPDLAEGFLNVVSPPRPLSAEDFASLVSRKLSASVRFVRQGGRVSRIGVCSGAGSDFVSEAAAIGCDAFLTGDASYHDFLDAAAAGVTLFAAGHFETENVVLPVLRERFSSAFPDVSFIVSERKAPLATVSVWQ